VVLITPDGFPLAVRERMLKMHLSSSHPITAANLVAQSVAQQKNAFFASLKKAQQGKITIVDFC
jgi:hypothetical protein